MNEALSIALVEDNKGDAEIIKEMVLETGVIHKLVWLKDGQQAVDFFDAGNRVDFLLLDLKLPKISGHEVVAFLKRTGVQDMSSVIVLTGSTSPRDMADANVEGVSCYLIKPMTIDEMATTSRMLRDIFTGAYICGTIE